MVERIKKFTKKTFSSLSIWNYRLYFFGQAVSLCGTWMQSVAQSWLVLKLTGSGTALGLVTALQFLPVLFFGAWGGVIVDRFSKRKLIFITQLTAGVLALALGIVVMMGVVELWMVYVFAVSFGFINVFDNPARQLFALEMVGKEQLSNVVSLNSMIVNGARAVGPAIAGLIIVSLGLAWCFMLNALSYGAILVALLLMRKDELQHSPRIARAKGQLREGFHYVWHTPILRNILLMMAFIGTFAYEFVVSLPLLAQFTFHGDARTFAAFNVAFGVGAVFGGLYSAHRREAKPRMLAIVASMFGIMMLAVSAAPTFLIALLFLTLVGFFSISLMSLGNVLLQLGSAPHFRGRVMALWTVAFLGSTPIGGPIIGWIGEYAGARAALATGGIAALIAAGFGLFVFRKEYTENEMIKKIPGE